MKLQTNVNKKEPAITKELGNAIKNFCMGYHRIRMLDMDYEQRDCKAVKKIKTKWTRQKSNEKVLKNLEEMGRWGLILYSN